MKFAMELFGKQFALGYDAGESSRMRKDLGWGRSRAADEDSLLQDSTRELIRQKAFDLKRNNGVVSGVCNRLALFTCGAKGMIPQARTSSDDWNKSAEQYFCDDFSKTCDIRERASLPQLQSQAVAMRPTHGGVYIELLKGGKIRPIECERIRNPQDSKDTRWIEGVQIDKTTGARVAYLVHDRCKDGGFSQKHSERIIKAENMIPVVTPFWRPDQIREVPDLAPVIPHLQDIFETNTYTLNTAKLQSMYISALKKNSGLPALGARGNVNTTPSTRQSFKTDWGMVQELFTGEELDLKSSPTPNAQHIPYVKFQYAICAAALGFPYEFLTLDLSGLDFSRQKGMLLLVNFACRPWREWLNSEMMTPLWQWSIAQAIDRGDLPPAPVDDGVSEWSQVEWQAPEELWIDRQEAMQADTMEIQAGLSTLTKAAKRRGNELETDIRQRAKEIKMIEKIAAEEGIDPAKLNQMQIPGQIQPGQNPKETPKPGQEADDEEKDDTKESDKKERTK